MELHSLIRDMQTALAGAIASSGWWAIVIIAAQAWYFAYAR